MENQENIQVNGTTGEKFRRPTERSAAYPIIPVQEAVALASEIYKNFRNTFANRDTIQKIVDGAHHRKLAAGNHYDILDRQKDSYKVSDLFRTISRNLSERDTALALLHAFNAPKLNRELIERFDGDALPTDKLAGQLAAFHHITDTAAPDAAAVFIQSARYVGALGEDDVLRFSERVAELRNPDFKPSTPKTAEEEIKPQPINEEQVENQAPLVNLNGSADANEVAATQLRAPAPKPQPLLQEIANGDRLQIKLTGGKRAYLSYPNDLNEKDIEILTLQLQALALSLAP